MHEQVDYRTSQGLSSQSYKLKLAPLRAFYPPCGPTICTWVSEGGKAVDGRGVNIQA